VIPAPRSDPAEITRTLALLCQPGEVYELRALNTDRGTASGYYTNHQALVRDAITSSDRLNADGVYLTLNPVLPALFARSANTLRLGARAKPTTGDKEIAARHWLLIDCDVKRPAGISSTDAEHELALAKARVIREYLRKAGWPEPIYVDSGNGGHLLYLVELPNDAAALDLLKDVLAALDKLFSDDAVKIDKGNFNASRICKLYGTVARKGSHLPERPHRLARILEAPEACEVVARELLEALAATLPKPEVSKRQSSNGNSYSNSRFDLDEFISQNSIEVKRDEPYEGGRRIILEHCFFNPDHTGTEAAIIELANGALVYKCQHDTCFDKHWADVRELFEPGYRERRAGFEQFSNGRVIADISEESGDDEPPAPAVYGDTALRNKFVNGQGENIRYVDKLGQWLEYHEDQGRWIEDRKLRIFTRVNRVITLIAHEVMLNGLVREPKKLAKALISKKTTYDVVALTKSHSKIAALPEQFDADPFMLNARGIAIDLRTGEGRPARPEDYFTKTTAVAPRDEPTPLFDRFMREIMGWHIDPDGCPCAACVASTAFSREERLRLHHEEVDALVAYQERTYGYALSGDVSEHKLFLQIGPGGNGKGTLNDFMSQYVFGCFPTGYSCEIPIEALLQSKGERHPTELMDLWHTRLALARESDEDTRWNEGRVKRLTGGDRIKARYMRQDYVEFDPTHKLFVFGNAKPVMRGADQAAWKRRIAMTEFLQLFGDKADAAKGIRQRDTQLLEKLKAEAPGVLHKLIKECVAWYRERDLKAPTTVTQAGSDYLAEQSVVSAFVDEFYERTGNPADAITVQEIWLAFIVWCDKRKEHAGARPSFNDKLSAIGIKIMRTHAARGVCSGLRLRPRPERDFCDA
jgi:P4 family phage/plasmid primase-like protien